MSENRQNRTGVVEMLSRKGIKSLCLGELHLKEGHMMVLRVAGCCTEGSWSSGRKNTRKAEMRVARIDLFSL